MASANLSDSAPVDEIKDLLTCSLCSKTLTKPRSLSCLHNFCKVCLGEYIFFCVNSSNSSQYPCIIKFLREISCESGKI